LKGESVDQPRTFWQFVAGIFSEADGTPSASRVISFVSSMVFLVIVFVNFIRTGQMPSATELAAGGIGANAAYIANKLSALFQPGGKGEVAK